MPWPKYLHIPSVEEFKHGTFEPDEAYSDFSLLHFPEHFRFKCGTQCCLVGHTAIAFGTIGYSANCIDENEAAAAFLKELCRRAGFPVPEGRSVGWWASDVFENEANRVNFYVPENHPGLTPKEAHRLWVETAAHFGYTVDVPVEETREEA